MGIWMLLWWLTEPVPLAVTSLLPVILLPLYGVLSMKDVTAPYANEMILLFLAGFLIAAALELWGAHTRLALGIVERAGRSGRGIVLGFMVATALLSMWISNTATAAMMYPIAMAVGQLFGDGRDADRLRTSLFLGLAYAASIGGMGTLIGTPPNLIFAAAARELLGAPIDFARYLLIGVPCVLILLPLCWGLLVHVLFRAEVRLGEKASATLARAPHGARAAARWRAGDDRGLRAHRTRLDAARAEDARRAPGAGPHDAAAGHQRRLDRARGGAAALRVPARDVDGDVAPAPGVARGEGDPVGGAAAVRRRPVARVGHGVERRHRLVRRAGARAAGAAAPGDRAGRGARDRCC